MTTRTSMTRYAIRQPDGQLVDTCVSWGGTGSLRSLGPETRAWVWEDESQAEGARKAIAKHLFTQAFGVGDVFGQQSRIVRLVIDTEVHEFETSGDETAPDSSFLAARVRSLISVLEEGEQRSPGDPIDVRALIGELRRMVGDDEPIADADVAAADPRSWFSVEDIPVGVRFRIGSLATIYERRECDCLDLASGAMYEFRRFDSSSWEDGFIEVLPESEQSLRTWKTAAEIPHGVRFTTREASEFQWQRSGAFALQWHAKHYDGYTSPASLSATWPNGFVEVLP